jgi:hypothetical protein
LNHGVLELSQRIPVWVTVEKKQTSLGVAADAADAAAAVDDVVVAKEQKCVSLLAMACKQPGLCRKLL